MNGKEWYKQQLNTQEWKDKRKEIYVRDHYACVDCGKQGVTIHCHHIHYVKGMKPWDYPSYALQTVCKGCHDGRHKQKVMVYESHEDAEMWYVFSDLEAHILHDELENRSERIRELEDMGATWDNDNRYFGIVDKHGRTRFFDEDGNDL